MLMVHRGKTCGEHQVIPWVPVVDRGEDHGEDSS